MVTINLLDDSEEDDDVVVVVDRSRTVVAADAAVVDLTSTSTGAAAGAGAASSRRRRRHNNNNNDDVQFIRSIQNNNNNNGVQFVGGNRSNHRSQLDDYRQQQKQRQRQQQSNITQSQSMYNTGNRNHPEVVAAAARAVTPARRFPANTTESDIRLAAADFVFGVGGGNLMMNHMNEDFGVGRQQQQQQQQQIIPPITPSQQITPLPLPSSSQRNKRKRSSKKKPPPPPPPPPMEKGKSLLVPTGFDALDMYYPHLKAQERTTVLCQLLPKQQTCLTKKLVHDWRVLNEKTNSSKQTLWSMVSCFSDYIISNTATDIINDGKSNTITTVGDRGNRHNDDDRKMPAKPKTTTMKKLKKKSSKGRCNGIISLIWNINEEGGNMEEKKKPGIGPLNSDVIDTLHTYFRAYVTRKRHKSILDNIEPIDDDDDDNKTGNGDSAITCSICSDDFDLSNTVPCSSEKTIHFFCKNCFESYVTVTVESGPIHSICCPIPDCKSLFSVADAKSNLSSWDLLMIEHRETNRDRRVALAAKAVLHCECGAVGIITENDIGNGRIICPNNPHNGCNKVYCCKCGNDDHRTDPCPPPVETVQWLNKNSKECPNCKNRIEKNGGCDHMTCQISAGGCGHNFWWTCGCPYKGQHKSDCLRLGER
jgi:hypothetical protein